MLENTDSSPFTATIALKLELNLSSEQVQGVWIALSPGPGRLGRDLVSNTSPSPAAGGDGGGIDCFALLNCPQPCNLQHSLNYG